MHSDSKKRRGLRYAPATPRFAAGDLRRYLSKIEWQSEILNEGIYE